MKYYVLLIITCFCNCMLIGEESAPFPGLSAVEQIGNEIQKEQKLYYKEGSLACLGRKAIYSFTFATLCTLTRDEMRAETLLLIQEVLTKLAKEPAIQQYFQGNEHYQEQLRASVEVTLEVYPRQTAATLHKSPAQLCSFKNDTFHFTAINPKNNNMFQVEKTETYKQAKELFDNNPITPQLTLSGDARTAV